MTICLYGAVEGPEDDADGELGKRLGQFALCCRGLEFAIDELRAGGDDVRAETLARIAAGLAEQSERLARALAAQALGPRN
jgi:hypothetical protein